MTGTSALSRRASGLLMRVGIGTILLSSAAWCVAQEGRTLTGTPNRHGDDPTRTAPTGVVRPVIRLVEREALEPGPATVRVNAAALEQARSVAGPFRVPGFPVDATRSVDLLLEPFSVTTPQTRFVVGRDGGPDVPLDFEPARVTLLRGRVEGYSGSRVFLAVSPFGSHGTIDLGSGRERFAISSAARAAADSPADVLRVFRAGARGGVSLPVPMCGTVAAGDVSVVDPDPPTRGDPPPIRGLQQIELAVETDYEYFELFGEAEAAGAYIVAVYGAISDMYIRDANARFDLTFVRLWDDPDDLFNEPDPLVPFRDYWNDNMGHVQRDVAQFFTGRRDLGAGGVAYMESLCSPYGYSWAGYALGFFADPSLPSVFNRDIGIAGHELGHSCGAGHTHGYGLDSCDEGVPPARRGTIMSYCGQTYSGGDANVDLRFHSFVKTVLKDFITDVPCVVDDCNQNGTADALDIQSGFSDDANGNGIPDECEDCNGNGQLDPEDIQSGVSEDLNGNGVPDECEPDCNDNNRPDDLDISTGDSADDNANDVPDECEPDLNENGVLDYSEIQADMSLDLDRNIILDDYQDCDDDGTPDLIALQSAHNIWATSRIQDAIREYLSITGTLVRTSDPGIVNEGNDLVITLDGRILVSSGADDRIVEFDRLGGYAGDFVPPGSGGLDRPTGMVFAPDGNLLVSSFGTAGVLEYDGGNGTFVGEFVSAGAGGLVGPYGLTFGPNGNLFVTSSDDRVIEFDGQSGALIGDFVSALDNGTLDGPRGLAFKPDGNLLVASFGNESVLEYEDQTGAFLGKWNRNGTPDRLTLEEPWCVRIGPDGDVYVSRSGAHRGAGGGNPGDLHLTDARIYHFDVRNGNMVRAYVVGDDTELERPSGFDFFPDNGLDCNMNLVPDSCDIADGTSPDDNGNGIPDECDCPGDLDGDGDVDQSDLGALLADWGCDDPVNGCDGDLNGDDKTDQSDLGILLSDWGCGT